MNTDGDKDSVQVKKAKNAIVNGIKSGKVKKPTTCDKCGKKANLEAHHHKGYDEKNMTNVQWLCIPCHKAADNKLRAAKRKKKMDESVLRYDIIDAPNWMVEEFHRTKEGFLQGRAVITNVGVFTYKGVNGDVRRELRLPEEVFSRASINSLRMKPITNDHPSEVVTPDNIKKYQVGSMGGNPAADGTYQGDPEYTSNGGVYDGRNGKLPYTDRYHLTSDMSITENEAITDVVNGKRALSAGYSVDLEETPGVWMGMPYDAIQRNISYNHVAIVDRGRAGDAARIVLRNDSADAVCTGRVEIENEEGKSMPETKTIKIDGMDYQVEPYVGKHISELTSRADKVKTENEKLKKENSILKADRDSAKDELEAVKKNAEGKIDQKKLDAAVEERMRLKLAMEWAGIKADGNGSLTLREMKEQIIVKAFPRADAEKDKEFKEALSKMDETYISGRFDAAVEFVKNNKDILAENTRKMGDAPGKSGITPSGNDTLTELEKKNDAADAAHVANICNAWDKEAE